MALGSTHFSLLALTLSIQGLPIAGQLLVAFLVGPTTLGDIRWLESVFSILLLATSCGMPSLVFRRSALLVRSDMSLSFAVVALALTALVGVVVLLGGGLIALAGLFPNLPTQHLYLILIATTVLPANAIRILVAHAQGAKVTKNIHLQVLIFSSISILVLASLTLLFKTNGWVIARLTLEFTLAVIIWRLLRQLKPSSARLEIPTFKAIFEIGSKGVGPNYAFLVRALADNLPILVLYKLVSVDEEAGLYSFATLLIFGPMLLLSTVMQAELPRLIQSTVERSAFEKCCNLAARKLFKITAAGVLSMFLIGLLLHLSDYMIRYTGSAMPLILLAVGLPARAFLLLAGGAAVARGWFAISSSISFVEILIIVCVIVSGLVHDASSMALGVAISTWCAMFPAFFLLRAAKNIKNS
jgi:hypothetical protein